MYPELIQVFAIKPFELELLYSNGEKRHINIFNYCQSTFFKQLHNWDYFKMLKSPMVSLIGLMNMI